MDGGSLFRAQCNAYIRFDFTNKRFLYLHHIRTRPKDGHYVCPLAAKYAVLALEGLTTDRRIGGSLLPHPRLLAC